MWFVLTLACHPASDLVERPFPDGSDTDLAADTAADADTDADSDSDTDTDADTDTDTVIETCWLGPNRDHTVCVPTVPYDATAFGSDYDYPPPYSGDPQYAAPDRYVDLDAIDPTLQIAPNFALSEFMEAYKGQWGVLQTQMVDHLQELRDAIAGPLTITSGYRNPAWNASVGGVEYSRHQYGDAADLDAAGWTVEDLGAECDSLAADYVGLYEDGHTHCDWRNDPLDPAFYAPNRRHFDPIDEVPTASIVRVAGVYTAPAEGFDEGEPYRVWTAWDVDGNVLSETATRDFTAPEGTAKVAVWVGGNAWAEEAVAPR